jgi:hypothetical protein
MVPTVAVAEVLPCSQTQTPPHCWITTFTHTVPQAMVPLELEILETELTAKI